MNQSVAERLVEAIKSDFPGHDPDKRPVHAIGVGVDGHFVASDVARTYCIAEHFNGDRVDASVRFSNGSGNAVQHDGWPDVRGMATRFHLSNGLATDLIAMTLGEFFTSTVQEFFDFTKAAVPLPVQKESPWRKFRDMLQLKLPLPDPLPKQTDDAGAAGMLSYANRHAFAQLAVSQAATIGAPVSYARACYHAVHTFIVTGGDGARRPVRFTWQPVAGVRTTDPREKPKDKYLADELKKRLQRTPARFILMMTVGEAGDALNDPTRPWPDKRVRVIMGTLTLTNVANDQAAACEHISFNPWRLTAGIDVSDDPILAARREAYEVSRKLRGGTSCPFNSKEAS